LHESRQRDHADAAGDGKERDDRGECVHEEKSIEGILQQGPDLASLVKHYYKVNQARQSIP